jgi:hypothetical protein
MITDASAIADCRRKIRAEEAAARLLERELRRCRRLALEDDTVAGRQEMRRSRLEFHAVMARRLKHYLA